MGTRFDYLKPRNLSAVDSETFAVSPYVTFFQSEFANFSLQYQHRENGGSADDTNALVFEATFSIGNHVHPVS